MIVQSCPTVRALTFRATAAISMGLFSFLCSQPAADAAVGDPVTACVAEGCLTGTTLDGDVHAFFGIPYAAPPVGDLRFRPQRTPRHGDQRRARPPHSVRFARA